MYYIENRQLVYRKNKNDEGLLLSMDDGSIRIVDCIIGNYLHALGPNYVVNEEEVRRMIPLIYDNVDKISEENLYKCIKRLTDVISTYSPSKSLNSTFFISKLVYRISQELVFSYNSLEVVRLMVTFAKDVLFKLYLTNRKFYQYIVAPFYYVMEIEDYSIYYGFYDVRNIYDSKNACGNSNAVNVDHIVIADIYSYIGVQMSERGANVPEVDTYRRISELTRKFWEACVKRSRKFEVSIISFVKLYNEAMEDNESNGFLAGGKWEGLGFVIADIHSNASMQKNIAKNLGLSKWNSVEDRRMFTTFQKMLVGVVGLSFVGLAIFLIVEKSIWWMLVTFFIIFVAKRWYFDANESNRQEAIRQIRIKSDISGIRQAAEKGTWYEPMYLNNRGYYNYVNYRRIL